MKHVFTKEWVKAALIRAVRTIAQVAIASIGTSAFLHEVNWLGVLSVSAMAGILSILTSLAGLPEVDLEVESRKAIVVVEKEKESEEQNGDQGN